MHPAMKKRTSFSKAPDFSAKHDTEAVLKGEKSTATAADYRQAPVDSKELCHECAFYMKPGEPESSCSKVVGAVKAQGTCDYWKQRSYDDKPESKPTSITIQVTHGI